MNPTDCPCRDDLSRFAVGDLSGDALVRVARHVERCAACEATLRELDADADPLVSALRQPVSAVSPKVPDALLTAARSALERPAEPPIELPRRVGKFELLEELGSGSFGTVYRARDTELGREVAIKIMRAGRFAGTEDTERFLREARSAAQLKHPGIVSLFEAGRTPDGVCYLVEELVTGVTLADRLQAGPFPPASAAQLVAEIADALHAAHSQGVIHRDLKPANILLAGASGKGQGASEDKSNLAPCP